MINSKFIYILSLSCIFLFSCNNEPNLEELDSSLTAALEREGGTAGLDFFKLPSSDNLSDIPQDPKNPITAEKVALGKNLFHETAFSVNGEFPITKATYSCASCHHAGAGFQAGLAQGIGEGGQGFGSMGEGRGRNSLCEPKLCDVQPIRSPTILNGAYQELMLWNGQFGATGLNVGTEAQWTEDTPKAVNELGFEGLETQAIAGLAVHRILYTENTIDSVGYKTMFDEAFPEVPVSERYNRLHAGLAIAAYERTVVANKSPFQQYLNGDKTVMSDEEKLGALLFFGDAQCTTCHTGPALNSMEFHALGMREFNSSEVTFYDPEDPTKFGRYSFTQNEADRYKFKVPQLYNLKGIEFLGHGASMHSVRQVLNYKNKAIRENITVPISTISSNFKPLNLDDDEIGYLVEFIENALYDNDLERFIPSELPSGNCFPNNDMISQVDLGCE